MCATSSDIFSMTKNFTRQEFSCRCGCGYDHIDRRVVEIAQTIRDFVGVPIRVNSGCRCEAHNLRVGGVKGSYHTKGLAADLSCSRGAQVLYDTVRLLQRAGKLPDLSYCILYQKRDFIHIDCGAKRSTMWEVRS